MSRSLPLVTGVVAALALTACGASTKPEAGTLKAASASHKGIDDARTSHVQCLRSEGIPVTEFGRVWFKVGTGPGAPQVMFAPTPGAAQNLQITGQVTGAEMIGSAAVYPEQGSAGLLKKVEACVAKGVQG